MWDCENLGGIWLLRSAHFDNVLRAIMTLFEMSTTVGWSAVMFAGVDSVAINYEP